MEGYKEAGRSQRRNGVKKWIKKEVLVIWKLIPPAIAAIAGWELGKLLFF
ncbi:MAG: hypothetical protein HFI31_17390 [Lachnospiraceae bacterium]|jgi:hypothetical protein|nr:hypothetical protein [Lachnospiraceae bacterium]MCI9135923.1 hypothetical protein [Lachnospiraceae bacterium]